MFQIFLTYGTFDEGSFLVFGVLNAKNLAFSTPYENGLRAFTSRLLKNIVFNNSKYYSIYF